MFLWIYLALLVAISMVLLHDFFKKHSYRWKMLSRFPGDYSWPLIGNALKLGFNPDESTEKLLEMWKRHGKQNFRVSVGSEDWVLLTNPDDIRILLNHPTELLKLPERNASIKPFFGNSVSTSVGEKWRSTRKLMNPSFHFKTFEKRVNIINDFSDRVINMFNDIYNNGPIEMYKYIKPLLFDIMSNTLMGVDYNLLKDFEHPYMLEGSKVMKMVNNNYYLNWKKIKPLYALTSSYKEMNIVINTLRGTSNKMISDRRQKLIKIVQDIKESDKKIEGDLDKQIQNILSEDACLLDSLLISKLPNGDPTPDEIINEEITLIQFVGSTTSSLTISHALYLISKNMLIQQKIFDEQCEIFKEDRWRKPTLKDLNQMKYLEATLNECMRFIPTVTFLGRFVQEDIVLTDGRIVPAGASIVVFIDGLLQDPNIYPDPETFNPDRFINSNLHPFAFIPFSAGPRKCLGFRYAWIIMKTIISNILRNFEVLKGGPGTEPQIKVRLMTESDNGIQLRLKKRVY